jgi:DNA-binding winged helix-turn-helix (wHTH) protein/tetratricopeptide (TPR) repeat protein
MAVSDGVIYEFDVFRLIPKDDLLLRDGEPVPLPPKAFSTLVLLLESRGHLVRKEELMEKIWADTFVDEAAISKCVWRIRNALGEDSKDQRFIRTVPKRGYKFVADVTVLHDVPPGSNAPAPEERTVTEVRSSGIGRPSRSHRFVLGRRRLFLVAATAVLAVGVLAIYVLSEWPAGSTGRGTDNEEAYRNYLLAQNFNELRGPENGRVALEQINRAVALDPKFARAWATKAYIHRYLAYGQDAVEHSLKSKDAVEMALQLDPNLSEAHTTLCFNKFRFDYDFDAAERACRRAIELDPNSPLAHKIYSNFLYSRGRFDEAIAEIKRAIDLQPVSYDSQQTYALALNFARRHAEAEAQWKQLVALNPTHKLIYANLARSLVQQGKEAEALEQMIKLLTLEKADDDTINRFRNAFAQSGWHGVTRERIRFLESLDNAASFDLVRLYAFIGDKDNAFKYLERAYRERSNMMAVVGVDPELDPLRSDARFAEFLKRIEGRNGTLASN